MKNYISLLTVPVAVGILSVIISKGFFSQTDDISAELGPLLSPGAAIVLPGGNVTLFSGLTKRYFEVSLPDITAVVKVATEDDVPVIINYAKQKGRAILAGSARHGWSTSMTSIQNGIMIDIDTLSGITIDSAKNTMTVGGGIATGNVIASLQAAKKETSTGICDCVGFLGAALGGGHGRFQGLHGLIADNLVSANVAVAGGEIITVSNESHSDLFWGLRGAGHNFGIVTEAVYKIYDQTNQGFLFSVDILYAPDQLEAIFTALNEFNEFKQPAETVVFVICMKQPDQLPLIALSFSSAAPAPTALTQLNDAFGHIPHLSRSESTILWRQANELTALGMGKAACAVTHRKSAAGVSLKRYDIPTVRKVYNSLAKFVTDNPAADEAMMLFETYPVHAIQAVDETTTAYAHRKERHIILLVAGYENSSQDAVAASWLKETADALHSTSGFEKPSVYLNYARGNEGFGALYGHEEWRQEKLRKLKRKYDPEGMFSGYHPIPRD